ncbi:hypothetical protein ACIA8K_16780 [Catenuloplanes sp. NPDC051500]|uniref:hypothetical protein n=1 Tax=Catenuloplanes sp. NPDC051500 TaxID=3363959 RepID=UPI0037B3A6BA
MSRPPDHHLSPTPGEHRPANGADDLLAAAGITVTEEGKRRARARRLAAEAWWTPERRAALRAMLGRGTAT